MTQPYSPHQQQSGLVPSGETVAPGKTPDVAGANAAVEAAGAARGGAGVLDVPRQSVPGNSGS